MKKTKPKRWKIQFANVDLEAMSDRLLLMNVYFTQGLTLVIALIILLFQKQSIVQLLLLPTSWLPIGMGLLLALAVLLMDYAVARFVPDELTDDGGMNEKLFANRPLWHIAVISLVVAICEELLFRGAIQHAWGPYWTSILFAAIHVRYLKHWIPTGMVFVISYALGWLYMYTGSIWAPITAHFAIDFILGVIIRFRRK